MKILLLEDEEGIRSFIKLNLIKEGYEVFEAQEGQQAMGMLNEQSIDIALLDVMVPGLNGFQVLKKIREGNQAIGVIMLTAKSLEQDKIQGLTLGADDYITKPFSPKELILRIQALARRIGKLEASDIKTKHFTLFLDKRILYKNDKIINMTQTEYDMMKYFLENQRTALSKDEILDHVWGKHYVGSINTLDVNISRLRRKIEDDPSKPKHIITVWGYGYQWEDDVHEGY